MTDLVPLDEDEADLLARHEATIRAGLDTFREVGRALLVIRDERLYRTTHGTFEDYCQDRWLLTRQHVNRLVQASEVVGILEPIGSTPTTESQARPLAPLRDDPAAVRSAWTRATDHAEAEQRPITAAVVERAVRDELAARRGEIDAAQAEAERARQATAEFNAATAHLVPQMEAEQPWALAAISVTRAVERLPLDIDPDELAANVPPHSAYRLDDLAAAVEWLGRLIHARKAIAS